MFVDDSLLHHVDPADRFSPNPDGIQYPVNNKLEPHPGAVYRIFKFTSLSFTNNPIDGRFVWFWTCSWSCVCSRRMTVIDSMNQSLRNSNAQSYRWCFTFSIHIFFFFIFGLPTRGLKKIMENSSEVAGQSTAVRSLINYWPCLRLFNFVDHRNYTSNGHLSLLLRIVWISIDSKFSANCHDHSVPHFECYFFLENAVIYGMVIIRISSCLIIHFSNIRIIADYNK